MSGFENFCKENDCYMADGSRGLDNLEKLLRGVGGYTETGWKHGSTIESFLEDNPGAIELLYEFIEKHFSEVFKEYEDEDEDEE